jgi:carboxyl-terminal processing protease
MKHRFLTIGAFVLVISSAVGGIVTSKVLSDDKSVNEQMKNFSDVLQAIEANYVEKIPPKKVVTGGINGLLRSLDPHSNFLDEDAYSALQEEQHGSFFGLGITIQSINGILTVISPIEGTPAFKAGLRAGDVIAEIEGEPTKGQPTNLLLRKLRGPKGTKVTITVEREGYEKPLHLTLTRDEIPVNSISYSFMIRPGIGYVRIKNFTETTSSELDDALQKLKEQNMRSLIVDLRFNTGGLLDQAIKVSDEFLEKGAVIVSTKGRIAESNTSYRSSEKNDFEDLPLVILVNRSSASASEIVAGAIQDHDRGLVVGTTTWGKGLVQSLYRVGNNTALALTTARYYTPSGRLIQRDYSKSFQDYYLTDIGVDEDPTNREKAFTETGREVFGGGGITPDIKVNIPENTKFMDLLNQEYAFFSFAKRFTAADERKVQTDDPSGMDSAKLIVVDRNFVVDDATIRDFKEHVKKLKIQYTDKDFEANLPAIKEQIRQDVFSAIWGGEEGYKIAVDRDPQVLKALEVMPKSEALLKERKEKTAKIINQ